MRRIATFLLAGFALVSFFSNQNARAADAVAVEPAYVTPGKVITLKWYFTGEKVLLSGGRFGKGVVVTGKTSITDTPRATTKYTFDVWYKVPAPKPAEPKIPDTKNTPIKPIDSKVGDAKVADPNAKPVDAKVGDVKATDPKVTDAKGADTKTAEAQNAVPKPGDPKAAEVKTATPPQEMVMQHVQYTTYAEVWSGVYPAMKTHRDSHGWQVNSLVDWKRDSVPTAAEGSDGLNYFQVEDDSVERMAIAIVPCQEKTLEDILKQMSDDVPAHYQNAVIAEPANITFNAVPAKMLTFTGIDLSHPGTKTSSIVLLFVRNNKAYILSARTGATHFGSRQPILEKMLRSFTFTK